MQQRPLFTELEPAASAEITTAGSVASAALPKAEAILILQFKGA
jgi:hypothetical protein